MLHIRFSDDFINLCIFVGSWKVSRRLLHRFLSVFVPSGYFWGLFGSLIMVGCLVLGSTTVVFSDLEGLFPSLDR